MQRRKGKSPGEPVETADPHSLTAHIGRHLAWLEARGYAVGGLWTRRADLQEFCSWCAEREVIRPPDLNRIVIDLFQRYISQRPKNDGDLLSATTQCKKLMTIAKYCKWLVRERLIAYDPAAELELPRSGIRLPKAVLTAGEAEDVLAVPDVSTVLGLRDRTILEVFYATGIRRSELIRLNLEHVEFNRGVLSIRHGKGDKDRFVPLGDRAAAWLRKYLAESRSQLIVHADERAVFLSSRGNRIADHYVTELVSKVIEESGIGKAGGCHLFRHTAATLMLEGGADIRFIQEMLGHASPKTTQVYTRVSLHKLKAVHGATHPGAPLKSRREEAAKEERSSAVKIMLDEHLSS
jgi:integrase/recombinase XerD